MKCSTQKILLSSTLVLSSGVVMANPIPDAGKLLQLQTIQPSMPQEKATIEEAEISMPQSQDNQKLVTVNRIEIQGNNSIATENLQALLTDAIGKQLSLPELQQLAYRITQYYSEHGFPYIRAYLPVQNLAQGEVTIAVLEARYDRVQLDNQSEISDETLQSFLDPLQSGTVITRDQLQHQLLLLERLHGVKTRNVMSAGRYLGTVDLMVQVQQDEKVTAYVGMDNHGNEYTKEWRANAGIGAYNVFGINDHIRFDAMSSGNLDFGRISYDTLINDYVLAPN